MLKRLAFTSIILLLLLIGSFFLLKRDLVLDYWARYFGEEDPREVIARVDTTYGQPKYRLPRKLVYKNLREGDALRYFDTISTDEKSTATIAFNSGLVLELKPNSILVLEKPKDGSSGEVVISFLQGNFEILQQGDTDKVILTKDNEAVDPSGTKIEPTVIPEVEELPTPTPTPTPTPVPTPLPTLEEIDIQPTPTPVVRKRPKESLPDDYIASMVKKQKPFFNRCYAQHLRLNPNAAGRMNLSFTIQPNGEVSNARILKSTISGAKLEKCTLNIIKRIKFREFDGEALVVNYPINYE